MDEGSEPTMQERERALQERAAARALADIDAIKARVEAVKAQIARGDPEVDTGMYAMGQLGLSPVVADEWGRLWIVDGTKLRQAGEARPEVLERKYGAYDRRS
jgi:hypothetical protein